MAKVKMFKFIFPSRFKICIFLGAVVFCFLPVAVYSQSSQNINVCKFKFAINGFHFSHRIDVRRSGFLFRIAFSGFHRLICRVIELFVSIKCSSMRWTMIRRPRLLTLLSRTSRKIQVSDFPCKYSLLMETEPIQRSSSKTVIIVKRVSTGTSLWTKITLKYLWLWCSRFPYWSVSESRKSNYDISIFVVSHVYMDVFSCACNYIVCSRYMDSVKNNQPPHIVFDTTITGIASETVKSLTSALGLPTVSASFGQEGDIRQWRDLNDKKRNYLLQVMPPADIIPEVIRSIVEFQNITNAAILYDESFGMTIFHNYVHVSLLCMHGHWLSNGYENY